MQKEAAAASAQASLAQAQDNLAYIEAGYNLELLQIAVDNAQVALDDAKEQLAAATILAPFNGIVAAVGASTGDEVTANDVIIHLVNTSVVEVDAAVDEIDAANVQSGQMAIITLDALPDARLMGQVTAVSPIATEQSGVVTYDIAVSVRNASQYELKGGMSATISIMTIDVKNVLLVPSNAVQRTPAGNVVTVIVEDGSAEERVVEIGTSNNQQTEIISGLSEGDQVLVQVSNEMSEAMQQFGQRGGFPGGMPPPPPNGFGPPR